MSEPPRSYHGERERNGGGKRSQDQRTRRSHRSGPPSNGRSSNQRHYSRNSSNPRQVRSVPSEVRESKWTHICSRRGIVLICAVLTNLLVLFCVVAAQVTLSGMSAMNFGGSFVDAIIPFEGVELQQVIGAVIYVIAVGLYLHFVIKVNSTDVCIQRERIYARNGYTWMNCNVGGADAAVALFGIITALLYILGSVLTGITLRNVIRYDRDRSVSEAERPAEFSRVQNPPRQSDIYI